MLKAWFKLLLTTIFITFVCNSLQLLVVLQYFSSKLHRHDWKYYRYPYFSALWTLGFLVGVKYTWAGDVFVRRLVYRPTGIRKKGKSLPIPMDVQVSIDRSGIEIIAADKPSIDFIGKIFHMSGTDVKDTSDMSKVRWAFLPCIKYQIVFTLLKGHLNRKASHILSF